MSGEFIEFVPISRMKKSINDMVSLGKDFFYFSLRASVSQYLLNSIRSGKPELILLFLQPVIYVAVYIELNTAQ